MRAASERRQEMIEFISLHRKTTIKTLMSEYGVCYRTVLRDLEILSCSYPINTATGPNGGISVPDGWYLSRSYLSDTQEAFLRSLLPGLQPEDTETMNAILAKFAKPYKEK